MPIPNHFLLEGIDRVGKDTLIGEIQRRHGYHLVLHYTKPLRLDCYTLRSDRSALQLYQEASFRNLFQLLRDAPNAKIICNRAHLGECVYAPLYRGYSGEYVFEIEREFQAHELLHTRLILLTEDFDVSTHFVDDQKSLGSPQKRREEQMMFLQAFNASTLTDKRIVCVTDPNTGRFKSHDSILGEVLA